MVAQACPFLGQSKLGRDYSPGVVAVLRRPVRGPQEGGDVTSDQVRPLGQQMYVVAERG